jgi:titin
LNGDFVLAYNGTNQPFTFEYKVEGLITGLPYRFKVLAENQNGLSLPSEITTIYACIVPEVLPAPVKESTTRSSISISWLEPESNGCPITGFTILRDTGNYDAMSISVDPSTVQNKPSLRQYTITGLTQVNSNYKVKVRAHNFEGFADSEVLNVILSAVPDKPSQAPYSDASITNEEKIQVVYDSLPASENGGSPILSSELQVDDGMGGEFTSLIGFDTESLKTQLLFTDVVEKGSIFRFRYRALNVNGWSPFSDISHLKSATIPQRPAKPSFVDSTSDSITLFFYESIEDGSQPIIRYELFVNEGYGSTTLNQVTTYDGSSNTHTLQTSADAISAGIVYKFKYRAYNSYGYSDFSEELNSAVGSFPA